MKPVLFLIYKRIDLVKIVFEEIRKYKPKDFYIASDGPKNDNEKILCNEVRSYILENIDWNCNVHTLFRNSNLGCKYAVSSAINWFFENEEEGIILEDDCLPSISFFSFCEKMLDLYRYDEKVMHISGCNYLGRFKSSNDYFFSANAAIWGWATWRRAWCHYDLTLDFIDSQGVKKFFMKYANNDYNQYLYWRKIYDKLYDGSFDTWDYSWIFTLWDLEGLSITPSYNLVKNIGFSIDALHTVNIESPLAKLDFFEPKFNKIKKKVRINIKYDFLVFYRILCDIPQLSYYQIKKQVSEINPSLYSKITNKKYSLRDKFYLIRNEFKKK